MHSGNQSYIQSVKLLHFRNYLKAELESEGKSVVLLGRNGSGKTNILEALSLLSKSTGLRNTNAYCMQNNLSTPPWLVYYQISTDNVKSSVSIARKDNRRTVTIDEKNSTYVALHKMLCMVWLIPQLDHVLLKSPAERLKFFDRVVHIFDENYSPNMVKYEKAKRDRKRILLESPENHHWLSALEDIMSASGILIESTRQYVLNTFKKTAEKNIVCSSFQKCSIKLESDVSSLLENPESAVSAYKERLEKSRAIDMTRQSTSFGVHNDNFQIVHKDKDLVASNCSTGEQKILLLSLLLTASTAKYSEHGEAPIMLLDDIMSHLDQHHKEDLITSISSIGCQMWITDVDPKNFQEFDNHFKYFCISDNSITDMRF